MRWDKEKRRWVDLSGRVVRAAELRERVDEYITKEQKDVARESKRLFIGAITVAAFFEFLRQKVTNWHSFTGSLAYGGEDEMTPERRARINQKILSELRYLNEFESAAEASFTAAETIATDAVVHLGADIPEGLVAVVEERIREALLQAAPSDVETVIQQAIKDALADSIGATQATELAENAVIDKGAAILDQLIGGTIPSRAELYAESSYATYENNVRAREEDFGATGARRVSENDSHSCDECPELAGEEFQPLDEIKDIGDTPCMSNCRCYFEFSYHGVEPLVIERRLTTGNILTA